MTPFEWPGRAKRALLLKTLKAGRRLCAVRYLRGEGIEIGALHMPLELPRRARATYLDRLSTEQLVAELTDFEADDLVEVELVDDGETLERVADGSQDFVIANHMIEHTEDPIGTLRAHLRVLRPGGRIFWAIPDKRRTFDRQRPVTSFEHVLRDHLEGPEGSRLDHYEEWSRLVAGDEIHDAEALERYAQQQGRWIHFHAWTRPAFRELLERCRSELELPLEVDGVHPNTIEFIAIITRTSADLPAVGPPRA